MKGAGFIGSGSYGCVFDRPLQCDTDRNRSGKVYKGTIGKVFKHEESALEEAEIQKLLEQIDPYHEFTVKTMKYCDVGKLSRSNAVEDCDLNIDIENASQIIYENGGKDLSSIMSAKTANATSFIKVFKHLRPVIVGLKRLNDLGYHHLDLKPENMLFNGSKISVIDFGLLKTSTEVFVQHEQGRLYFDYLYYPPEFKFWLYCQNKPSAKGLKTFVRKYDRNLDAMHMMRNYELFRGVSVEQQLSSFFHQFVSKSKEFVNMTKEFKTFVGLSDVFSLGMTLFMMYVFMVKSETARTTAIKDFINKLIALSPYERYSWDKVIDYYDYVMTIIDKKHYKDKKN